MRERVDAVEPLVPDFYHYDDAPIADVRVGDDGLTLEWPDGQTLSCHRFWLRVCARLALTVGRSTARRLRAAARSRPRCTLNRGLGCCGECLLGPQGGVTLQKQDKRGRSDRASGT